MTTWAVLSCVPPERGVSTLCGLTLFGSLYMIAFGGVSVGTLPFIGSAAFSVAVLAWVVRDIVRSVPPWN
jgi:hypothetical protein